MPLKPHRKPRKRQIKSDEIFDPRLSFRTYTDFINHISCNNIIDIFEMDCVEGLRSDNQVFLTLIHERSGFMIARILPSHTQKEVKKALDKIEKQVENKSFKKIFKVILTDRGHEFQNFESLEGSTVRKEKRTQVFFCDPNSAYQKGTIEQSHTLLRRIFPKGRSIEKVTQDELNLAISSINTLTRAKLGGLSPYQVFTRRFGEDIARKLGIEKVNLDELTLRNRLFHKK